MKGRHSQETVIKCALEGRKVAPANTCRCVYMDARELCGNPIHHPSENEYLHCLVIVVVVQSLSCVGLFAIPWTAACQVSLSSTISWSLLKLISLESVMPSNHLILCFPLLLLPSIFPSIRVFSKELALCIRWPNYCSLSFSTSPSNKGFPLGLTSLVSLQSKGPSGVFSNIIVLWHPLA